MKSITLELGHARRWREFMGGSPSNTCWERVNKPSDRPGTYTVEHRPRVYRDVLVTDAECAGLLAEQDAWTKARTARQPDGTGLTNRMLRVKDVKEAGPDPTPAARLIGTDALANFASILAEKLVEVASRKAKATG